MCPDDALLSAHADGEVPSPWKERLDSHISGCSRCTAHVAEYRALSQTMARGFTSEESRALSLAKSRIGASIDFSTRNRKATASRVAWRRELWSRRVALPMPFLAISAAAFVLLFGATMGLFRDRSPAMAAASGSITVQAASLEMMAQYLRQQSVQPVMIEIPSESVFYQPGNPLIVSDSEGFVLEPTTTSYGSATR